MSENTVPEKSILKAIIDRIDWNAFRNYIVTVITFIIIYLYNALKVAIGAFALSESLGIQIPRTELPVASMFVLFFTIVDIVIWRKITRRNADK